MNQSEDKFKESFEKSPIGILFFDKEGNLTDANQSTLEIAGVPSLKDVIGLNIFGDVNIGSAKDELIEKGHVKLQAPLNFDNFKKYGVYNPKRSGIAWIDLTISVIDSGFLAQIQDITESRKSEERFHKEVKRESFLLEIYKKSPQLTDKELYRCALDYTVNLTDSTIGFLHIVSDDQKNIILDTWNNETLRTCNASFKTHYPIEQAGNWTDCIQSKGPVVYNDFKDSPNQKGLPEGHVLLKRFMSIPVFDGDNVKFIFGVGNKTEEYDDHDLVQIQSVANELYKIIKQRHSEQALKQAHDNLEIKVKERTSELQEAYKLLSESELKFREIFNKANDMITLNEMEDNFPGKFIEINEVGIKRLGYNREELLNMTPRDIVAPEKRPKMKENARVLIGKGCNTFEIIHLTKDGEKIPVEVNNHLINYKGQKVCLAISRDISERKKAEEELQRSRESFRALAENSPDLIIRLDRDLRYVYINSAVTGIIGQSPEYYIGKTYEEAGIPEKYVALWKESNLKAIETGEIEYQEFEFRAINGLIFIESTVVPESNVNGDIESLLILSRDITERKEAEKRLKETINELERSNEELQQFAYVSSHDLQEPLRTIASFTQLLERRYKGQFDSDADEFMDYIVEAAVRMKAQIEGLLEYSRVATKGEEFQLVNINDILNETLKNLDTSIKEADAEIIFRELPIVMGDAVQLRRVFQNLISNAIKFRKQEKSLKIHISATKDEENNEYVFSVTDNGIGIEEQYSERIFTIFQRLHTRDVYKGTGIGLSIVKRIIEKHGGLIWVESEFGVGSTFYFTIPVKE